MADSLMTPAMSTSPNYTKYVFRDHSGWIVDSRLRTASHTFFAIGHTAFLAPWSDVGVHFHRESEEFYILRHGELDLYVAGEFVTLHPGELLMILPGVPHAIVGGRGPIEHFGIRAPALDDKQVVSDIPSQFPYSRQDEREVQAEWGCRIPLTSLENQNCWLIGWGAAKFRSRHLILANLSFPTPETARTGIGTRLRMHYHQQSWEYYCVLKGSKVVQIEDELIGIEAGEILEVPPCVRHNVYHREAPYEGFTIRVPITTESDKVEDDV